MPDARLLIDKQYDGPWEPWSLGQVQFSIEPIVGMCLVLLAWITWIRYSARPR